jgi:DNA polymerase-3 subunit delta
MKKIPSNRIGYTDLHKNILKNEISPIYIFIGNQTYLIDETLSDLKKILLGSSPDFNFSLFYGDSTSAKEIINSATTYPMLSRMRLVTVKNAEKLPENELRSLDSFFLSPSPSTCLVLIFSPDDTVKSIARAKPGLENTKGVVFVDFDIKDVSQALKQEVKKFGYDITKEAIKHIISLVGENMQDIYSELQKLVLFAGERKTIGVDDVEKLIHKSQFQDVFGLINAIWKKDKKKALNALIELELRDDYEPLVIINRIGKRFRDIWKAKELMDKNAPDKVILKEVGVSPGALYYIRQDAKNFSYEDIRRVNSIIYEGDNILKTSYIPKKLALTKIILELCN